MDLLDILHYIEDQPDLEESFLSDLFKVMQEGKFDDDTLRPAAPEEVVVGKMNNLEKTLNVLRRRYKKEGDDITNRLNNQEGTNSPEEVKQMMFTWARAADYKDLAETWLWKSIGIRFREKDKQGSEKWTIRAGFQVVLLPAGPPCQICVFLS